MIKVSNLSKVFRTEEIETTALNGVAQPLTRSVQLGAALTF